MALCVGIAGGTGSGKTTLSRYLAGNLEEFRVRVIHMDKFYRELRPRTIAPLSGQEYEDFNHPDALDLEAVGRELREALEEEDIVLIEGFLLFAVKELVDRLDYKIFVDCPSDERLARRLGKFKSGKYTQEETVREYLELVRPRHDSWVEPTRWQADLVLNGSLPTAKGGEMLLEWIRFKAAQPMPRSI
ncbi:MULTISPECIES: AAA family ATPase [unclassified Paenibacillus]|uniref:uridine kinase family protein n=1 Tax=unclassified Paenibacillus TaxID=185978 RepID=UPI000954552F|nr:MULTISPECIES: AAA family ATPase [unclassified Paenibacillus]ASS67043.1 AAA family ATPase [Paenibacillus sp. RUD330]SIR48342.1 uridine kinase [Paenibacillus sp. RU4X]SIR57736.1 uridine kinase [Paenibacillus sp. RU4T]